MRTPSERYPCGWRLAALLILAASGLASCGGSGYGGGGGNMPVAGVGPSKLFAADSTNMVVGSLANRDPAAGSLMVDRLIGKQPNAIPYNYVGFTANLASLALDTARDILYVGNGASIIALHAASTANGDFFLLPPDGSFGSIGNTGSMFLDSTNDRLYVGDDPNNVKVYSPASTASGSSPTPRLITGMSTPIHGVAVDVTNKILYVSNDTVGVSTTHQIMVFDSADTVTNASPNRTITPTVLAVNLAVGGISLDATHDRLYVAPGVGGNGIMVFNTASAANGAIAPDKTLTIAAAAAGILNVVVDAVNDRLYAVGSNGHIYLIEAVGTLNTGNAAAMDASLSNGGMLTAVAVNPN